MVSPDMKAPSSKQQTCLTLITQAPARRARGRHPRAVAEGEFPGRAAPVMQMARCHRRHEQGEGPAVAGCLRTQHRRPGLLGVEHRVPNTKVTHPPPQGTEGRGRPGGGDGAAVMGHQLCSAALPGPSTSTAGGREDDTNVPTPTEGLRVEQKLLVRDTDYRWHRDKPSCATSVLLAAEMGSRLVPGAQAQPGRSHASPLLSPRQLRDVGVVLSILQMTELSLRALDHRTQIQSPRD